MSATAYCKARKRLPVAVLQTLVEMVVAKLRSTTAESANWPGHRVGISDTKLRDGAKTLKTWLAEHKAEWIEAGPPRRLGYHGPMTPVAERRWEVQIPVKSAK